MIVRRPWKSQTVCLFELRAESTNAMEVYGPGREKFIKTVEKPMKPTEVRQKQPRK